jgi:peroxiredoxin
MARFKRCPLCRASVKLENLERHARRAHPGRKVDFGLREDERDALEAAARRRPTFRRTERLLYPVLAVLVVVAILVVVVVYTPPHGSHEEGTAPDFALTSSDGRVVRLSDYRGQPILLDFMDTDCHFCQEETSTVLVPLHASYGDRVVFLSVDVSFVGPPDTFEDIKEFKAVYGATWTYVLDDGTVARKYGVTGTPTTFILDSDLRITSTFRGMTDYGSLSTALEAVAGG